MDSDPTPTPPSVDDTPPSADPLASPAAQAEDGVPVPQDPTPDLDGLELDPSVPPVAESVVPPPVPGPAMNYSSPPGPYGYPPDAGRPVGAMDHLIPSKNGSALTAYYCGVFSLIPCLGLLLGPAAIGFGVKGLSAAKALPERVGRGHAITGVVLGTLAVLANYGVLIAILISIATQAKTS